MRIMILLKIHTMLFEMKPDQLQRILKVLGFMIYYDRKICYSISGQAPYEVLYDWVSYMDVLKLKRVEDMTERYYNSMQF